MKARRKVPTSPMLLIEKTYHLHSIRCPGLKPPQVDTHRALHKWWGLYYHQLPSASRVIALWYRSIASFMAFGLRHSFFICSKPAACSAYVKALTASRLPRHPVGLLLQNRGQWHGNTRNSTWDESLVQLRSWVIRTGSSCCTTREWIEKSSCWQKKLFCQKLKFQNSLIKITFSFSSW